MEIADSTQCFCYLFQTHNRYDAVSSIRSQHDSAPIVAGSDNKPAYKVTTSKGEETLSAQEVATKYLGVLIGFASDFLGKKIDAAVVGVPSHFNEEQCQALEKACQDAAGVKVLQFLHEPAAAAVAYNLTVPSEGEAYAPSRTVQDRNVVVLDIGAHTTTSTVLAARQAVYVPLSSVREEGLGGESFDEQLIQFFSKEFTKKNKVKIESSNHRAMMKLQLSCETTKRTLSASNSANCSIESLAEGMDYHGSINRSRFDLLSAKVYSRILDNVSSALKKADLDPLQVQEVILIGGTCKNPSIAERLGSLFPESTLISSQIEPDQVIARGCVLQARALANLSSEDSAYISPHSSLSAAKEIQATKAPIGLLVPAPTSNGSASSPAVVDEKIFVTVIEANTPLPARRIVELPFGKGSKAVKLTLAEGEESIHVEAPATKEKSKDAEDSDEDDDEEEDVRTRVIKPTTQLAEVTVAVQDKSSKEENVVRLSVIVKKDGKVEIEAKQATEGAEAQKMEL